MLSGISLLVCVNTPAFSGSSSKAKGGASISHCYATSRRCWQDIQQGIRRRASYALVEISRR